MSTTFFEEKTAYIQSLYQAIAQTKEMLHETADRSVFDRVLQQLYYIENKVVTEGRRPRAEEGEHVAVCLNEMEQYASSPQAHAVYAASILQLYNAFIRYSKEADSRPKLVKEAAVACLKRLKISFNEVSAPEYHKNAALRLLNGSTATTDFWVVPYTYTVFQEEDAFIYLDDRYFELIYILTPHGYIRG